MRPVLIAMCGLPFSGKSVLGQALGIRVPSYDFEIYQAFRHLVSAGSPVTAEHDFVQDIARRRIREHLTAGGRLIYDDLLLERDDRRKLATAAAACRAELVLVYLDTPAEVIAARWAQNSRAPTRASVPDVKLALDSSLLEPPGDDEQPVRVRPEDALPDIVGQDPTALPSYRSACHGRCRLRGCWVVTGRWAMIR
jgi:predicted kinase